jgi:HTH-type transcriptional regulator/antitoxin HigA
MRNPASDWCSGAAIDARWGATEGTKEGDKLDVLTALVEVYESK